MLTATWHRAWSVGAAWAVLVMLGSAAFADAAALTFAAPAASASGAGPVATAAADLNGDGLPDLVTANIDSDTVSVFLSNVSAPGTFDGRVDYPTPAVPRGVTIMDVNVDGVPDLVVISSAAALAILLGDASAPGTFEPYRPVSLPAPPGALAVLDLNGDGLPDIAIASQLDHRVTLVSFAAGGPHATLQAPLVSYAVGGAPGRLAVGDFNNDGVPDLAVTVAADAVAILLGSVGGGGPGRFLAPVLYPTGAQPDSIVVGDFNRDGVPDLAVGTTTAAAGRTISVLLGDVSAPGAFGGYAEYPAGPSEYGLAAGDVDGDGTLDIVVADGDGNRLRVLPGRGDGTFLAPVPYPAGSSPMAPVIADVDGDGRADLAAANVHGNTVSILLAAEPVAAVIRFKKAVFPAAPETSSPRIITVVRSGDDLTSSMTVDYAASDGTATEASGDYVATSGTLTFASMETSLTFELPVVADDLTEGEETINLTLSNPGAGAMLGEPSTAVVIIAANDPPVVHFSVQTYATPERARLKPIVVTRRKGFGAPFTVDYATSDGTATAGQDYTATSGTLSFGADDNSLTFPVPILEDALTENAETINLTLSNASEGVLIGPNITAVLTILINDQPPAITSPAVRTFAPGKSGQSFTVTTTGIPTNTISRTGILPSGVTFTDNGDNTATVAGTPAAGTQAGSPYAWIITATNGVVPDATQSFTFKVVCPAITVSGAIPPLTFGAAMAAAAFTRTGGNGPFAWSAAGLPAGTSINAGTGQVTGTPTVTGTFDVMITVTDVGACTGSRSQSVTVAPVSVGEAYAGLVDNTQFVLTGGVTPSPSTPFVGAAGTLTTNDAPSGSVTATAGTFATSKGGSVTIAADGTFIYTPKADPGLLATTSDSFTYTVSSNTGGGAPVASAPATVSLTLSERVWYVRNDGGAGNGQSHSTFRTLSAANAASMNGDTIYVYRGDGTTAHLATASLLKPRQRLIGQGAALVANGHTLAAAGGFPSLGKTVRLAVNVTVDGIDMSTGASSGIVGTDVTGVTVTVRNLGTTTGTAVAIGGASNGGTFSFRRLSADGAQHGISLANLTSGSFTVTGDGATTGGFLDRNGSGGTINQTTGHAVLLTNASRVTLRQMNITETAAGGACPAACASNAVDSTGGRHIVLSAMLMQGLGGHGWSATDIRGDNRFDHNGRIAAWNTPQANGILVVNTDTDLTSFTIDRALLTTSATGAAGVSFTANGATTGIVKVTSSEFTAIDQSAVQIDNNGSGTLTAIVKRNDFHDADATGGDGNNTLYLTNNGSGQLNFTVGGPAASEGNAFRNVARTPVLAGVIQVDSATAGTIGSRLNGSIQHNTITNDAGFTNGRRAIDIQVESNASTHGGHAILIADNTVGNVAKQGVSITLATVGGGDTVGNEITVRDNTFTNVGTEGNLDSGSAIEIESNADAANVGSNVGANVLLQGNTASNSNTSLLGSTLEINNRAVGGDNTSVFNVTAWGNSLTNGAATASAEVFEVMNSIGDGTANPSTCLDLNSANAAANANTYTGGAGTGFKLTRSAGTFGIAGMGAGAQLPANVQAFLSPRNNDLTVTASGDFVGTPSCPLPSLPTF